MMSRNRYHAAVLLAGLTVLGGVSVPIAGAQPACRDGIGHVKCETNGSVSIRAVPDAKGSGLPDPSSRIGSQGRRSCYTDAFDRSHIC